MNVLILGAAGMLGPYVVRHLAPRYTLRISDVQPPGDPLPGEFIQVDVVNREQVLAAAEGMDAIINLSVLRQDRKIAFDVNTLGCYHMMEAAVTHGIRRVINTGPHFTLAGRSYEMFDYDIGPDIPPQPGTNLYALSKSLGHQISRVYAEQHDLYVQMYLFYNFRDPTDVPLGSRHAPFSISWENAAEVFSLGLEIPFEKLPSRCEAFNIFTDMPHGKFSNEKAKRILGFQPRNDISGLWRVDKGMM
ncbi:MAG: NAD(P)-dependent oxidoreductase [Caldilineaceae bacterium]|nr:NAD(P)-dependent oxidoreductase [Caldilineaceae bacterium]